MADRGVAGAEGSVPKGPPPPQGAKQPPRARPVSNKSKNGGGNSCGLTCVKYCLFIVNLAVWLLGLAVIVVSAVALAGAPTDEAPLAGLQSVRSAAATGLFIGCLLFLVGFLGCCGSMRESPVMLTGYFVILLVIAVFLIAVMALAFSYVNSSTMENALNEHFKDVITGGRRDKDPKAQEEDMDTVLFVQAEFRCCGGRGPQDYIESGVAIPPSCYDPRDSQRPYLFQTGCSKAMQKYILRNGLGLGLISFFTLLALIIAMVFSCLLIQGIKKGRQLHTSVA
ncbi:hypothetical protein V5799_022450 [Amblyomma americanum]|uniref:Tetraspanin n=1 Tax=Amblyomma americanum TaxID=6943 RepID=A0AAQ4FLW9_AMBAM